MDFVKIDAEGGELNILKGARGILAHSSRPVFLMELADIRTQPWGYACSDLYDHLEARDYRWFYTIADGRLRSCPKRSVFHDNLIAIPREKLRLLSNFIDT